MLPPKVEGSPRFTKSVPDDREFQPIGRMQDEVLGVLAHELRNPLAAIRNALQVSRRCDNDVAKREWVQGMLERQTHQMGCLIEGLLDFSRISHGKVQLQKSSVDLAQMVGFAVETVRPYIDERRHVLEVTLPTMHVTLDADPTWMQQMLTNLLVNATKYTDLGGRIWLTAMPEGDEIVLRVRDSGIGIAPETLPQVFDSFWQSPRAAGRPQSGLGIGLALVRQIVEMHGGCVTAFSAGLDQGSEFIVHLPRTTSSEKHSCTPCAEEAGSMSQQLQTGTVTAEPEAENQGAARAKIPAESLSSREQGVPS